MFNSVCGERKQSWHKYVCLINGKPASWDFLIPIQVSRCRLLESWCLCFSIIGTAVCTWYIKILVECWLNPIIIYWFSILVRTAFNIWLSSFNLIICICFSPIYQMRKLGEKFSCLVPSNEDVGGYLVYSKACDLWASSFSDEYMDEWIHIYCTTLKLLYCFTQKLYSQIHNFIWINIGKKSINRNLWSFEKLPWKIILQEWSPCVCGVAL